MTIVIALKDEEHNRIILGADGQGTSEDMQLNFGNKIIKLPLQVVSDEDAEEEMAQVQDYDYLYICLSGNHYLLNYLAFAFTPPSKLLSENILDYLYNQFFQVLINGLNEKKLLKENEGALESGAGLIIVYKDKIFNVYSDFSIVEEPNKFTCNGSGWKIATSVLTNLLNYHNEMDKLDMVLEALETTSQLNIYCNNDITTYVIPLGE